MTAYRAEHDNQPYLAHLEGRDGNPTQITEGNCEFRSTLPLLVVSGTFLERVLVYGCVTTVVPTLLQWLGEGVKMALELEGDTG